MLEQADLLVCDAQASESAARPSCATLPWKAAHMHMRGCGEGLEDVQTNVQCLL